MDFLTNFIEKNRNQINQTLNAVDFIREKYAILVLFMCSFQEFMSLLVWKDSNVITFLTNLHGRVFQLLLLNAIIVILRVDIFRKVLFIAAYAIVKYGSIFSWRDQFIFLMLSTLLFVDIDYVKAIKAFAWSKIVLFVMFLVLNFQKALVWNQFNSGDRIRHSFGFGHPNTVGIMIVVLFLSLWIAYFKEKVVFSAVVSFALFVFVWKIVDSQTSAALLLFFTVVMFVSPALKIFEKYRYVLLATPALCCLTSFILTKNAYSIANKIGYSTFMARFIDPAIIMQNFKPEIWGQNYYDIIGYTILDNAYMRLLLVHGVIITALFLFAMTMVLKSAIDNKHYEIVLMTIILLIHGLMEWCIFSIGYNMAILIIFCNFNSLTHLTSNRYKS